MGIFSRKPNIKRLKRKRDIEGLIEALEHRDYPVRQEAAKALGLIGDSRAVPSLLKLLDRWNHDDIMQTNIIDALGEIGSLTAVDTLIDALLYSKYDFVRAAAAVALGKIGDWRAVRPLINTLRYTSIKFDDQLLAKAAAARAYTDAFGVRVPNAESIELDITSVHLEAMCKVLIRQKAAEALGKIGDPQAIGALNEALEDKTLVEDVPVVREAAKEALERIQKEQRQ